MRLYKFLKEFFLGCQSHNVFRKIIWEKNCFCWKKLTYECIERIKSQMFFEVYVSWRYSSIFWKICANKDKQIQRISVIVYNKYEFMYSK